MQQDFILLELNRRIVLDANLTHSGVAVSEVSSELQAGQSHQIHPALKLLSMTAGADPLRSPAMQQEFILLELNRRIVLDANLTRNGIADADVSLELQAGHSRRIHTALHL